MRRSVPIVILLFAHSHLQTQPLRVIKGADVSFVAQIEANGGVYYDEGFPGDLFVILRSHGINFIRLRLWHTPANGVNGLQETLSMARRARDAGFGVLLDFHYSDSWADPGQQTKPAAWTGLPFTVLKDSLYRYTKDVITAFRDQQVLPDIVQLGNEIICGMLWDDGRVCDTFNTSEQWGQLGALVAEGVRGVHDAIGAEDTVRIMIHIDRGGDNAGSRWFLDNFMYAGSDFDIIGLSFYPWWHGTLDTLAANLNDLSIRYKKDIMVVETAYPWTLDWYDNTHNIVGEEWQLHDGYPATVDGQEAFLRDLIGIVRDSPEGRGTGVFYWAPEWISAPTLGSAWENVALFDFGGNLLSSIRAFDTTLTSVRPSEEMFPLFHLYGNFPNPFNSATSFCFRLESYGFVRLTVFDILGRKVGTPVEDSFGPGTYRFEWTAGGLSSGPYFYTLSTGSGTRTRTMFLLR